MVLVKILPKSARTMSRRGMPKKAYTMVAALPAVVLGGFSP